MQIKKRNEYYLLIPENLDEEASVSVIDFNGDQGDREPFEAVVVHESDIQDYWIEYLVSTTIGRKECPPSKWVDKSEIKDVSYILLSVAIADKFHNQN